MRRAICYIGGPQDGLREWRDDNGYEIVVPQLASRYDITKFDSGERVADCVVQRHTYILRPAGRDEYGQDVFVAIHEPMLRRG